MLASGDAAPADCQGKSVSCQLDPFSYSRFEQTCSIVYRLASLRMTSCSRGRKPGYPNAVKEGPHVQHLAFRVSPASWIIRGRLLRDATYTRRRAQSGTRTY